MTFRWNAALGALRYRLSIGTRFGVGDLYDSYQGTATSVIVSTLPANGHTLYVRLWSQFPVGWRYSDVTYFAASGAASITSPPIGTILRRSARFSWSAGSGALAYRLTVGSTRGGVQIYDRILGLDRSTTVSGLPSSGGAYVRLWTKRAGGWTYQEYVYDLAP